MVSTRPPTSKSSSPFNYPLVTVPKASITIGINVTFMFHSFFNYLARSKYLSFFSLSFSFILWSAGTEKSTILQILFLFFSFFVDYYFYYFFLLIIFCWLFFFVDHQISTRRPDLRSGLLAEIWWSVCMSKFHTSLLCHFLG